MKKATTPPHLLLVFIGLIFLPISTCQLAPAVYVFGDSLSDSGNNNALQTQAKANYAPYGFDFSGPTGRFTNGRTFADIIAQLLGLPFAPPYMGLSAGQRSTTTTGINYASGSAGILTETGTALGRCISLKEQVDLFKETQGRLSADHLSKAIFQISIGSNDYFNNYLSSQYNSSPCSNKVNGLVSLFNAKLPSLLNQLQSRNLGSVFVHNKIFDSTVALINDPAKFAPGSLCLANTQPCGDRRLNVFWDSIHPTEAVSYTMAVGCFNSTGQRMPVNVQQLASA
ncbi:GDSL esterase/lipase [Acorus calamus]|uniref:GDSL esterase/lipase n=1 Tax=Acorus calamus TaxID=4465 RepID=A0AAV9ETG2_ACOCL|nr:GDSL esterase/lipase [Acorus calamus]